MTLYNLFLYLFIRDKSYFYYVLYCAFITLYYLGAYDLPIELLNVSSSNSLIFTFFTLYLFVASSAQFVRHFLLTRDNAPKLDRLLKYFSAWGVLLAALSFAMEPGTLSVVGGLTGLVMGGLYIYAGISSYRAGFYSARYFLLAWLLFMLASIAYSLVNLGIIDFTMTVLVVFQAGNLLEMLLLSVALANRITMLSRQRDKAELRAEARSMFLANMSHELRTPISAIMGMNELARNRNQDRELDDYLSISQEASKHLLSVVDDILNLSKIEAGVLVLDSKDFDMAGLVESTLDIMLIEADKKGVELRMDIPKDLPVVKGDQVRLKQVLINLLSNALKFTQKGHVRLKLEYARGRDMEFKFAIKDTGPGISQADQEHIFTSFVQADGTDSGPEGTGLGLAICKRLVEMMGGEIWVKSAKGQGSEFFFTARLMPGDRDKAASQAELPKPQEDKGPGLKILVAEDNRNMAFYIQQIFKTSKHEAVVVKTGTEALSELEKNDFDLVLMDMRMPGLSGTEATRLIRQGKAGENNRTVPIIGLSAHILDEHRQQCLDAGMNGFITKPVKKAVLMERLADISKR